MNAATLIEPGTVKMERLLPGPVERVWAYLTESKKRARMSLLLVATTKCEIGRPMRWAA